MNERERFLNTMRFKPVDRVPFWPPLAVWNATLKRWMNEGLTDYSVDLAGEHSDETLRLWDYLGCDRQDEVGIYYGFCPGFEYKVIAEDEKYLTYRNHEGITMKELKEDHETSMPHWLDYPIKTRQDYLDNKFRLTLNFEERFPNNWNEKCKIWNKRKVTLRMWADREGGFFGPQRNLFGVENLSYLYYDDPEFIEEVLDDRAELMIQILDRILQDVKFDYFVFWEDMCYKNGPLVSPEIFKKFMVPRYKKVTDFLRSRGIDLIVVDSDGDVTKLVPLWLEAGVNGVLPFEVQCGMDVVKFRKEYGNDLLMIGGIDKRALIHGEKTIDAELARIAPLIEKGGYIPWLDHSVPPDVSFDNFLYYMDRLERLINGKV
jgi:hypothetical protein